jgi:GTP-binding protein
MKIKTAQFLISSPSLELCPKLTSPEFALLGRSNVGKSSFINALARNNKLAKTSNTPGKTRLINLFQFETSAKGFTIADLPGYGYAKVSKTMQNEWQKHLEKYLLERESLTSTVHFIDARHEIQKNDFQMHDWLKINNIPSFSVLTKCDYISKNEVASKLKSLEKYFQNTALPFSTKENRYLEAVLKHLENLII